MAKNIEMNYLDSGGYEVLYPKTDQSLVINLINDDTKELIGIDSSATADEAFHKIAMLSILSGKAYFEVQVNVSGAIISQLKFTSDNFCDSAGTKVPELYTNEEGKLIGFCDIANPNISLSGYADIQEYNGTLNIPELGKEYNDLDLSLISRNFVKYDITSQIMFSNNVSGIDFTVVGGGGGGGNSITPQSSGGDNSAGAGGGGGYCDVITSASFIPNQQYDVIIGSGGLGGGNYGDGGNGGTSTFLGTPANGGLGGEEGRGRGGYPQGGAGNGKGGGYNESTREHEAGQNGGVYGYSSFIDTVLYGGGGGAGMYGSNSQGQPGGSAYGAYGGRGRNGYSAESGTGGGGGGAGGRSESSYDGGNGGSGCVAIRMHLKST